MDNKKFLKLPGFSLTTHTANKHHGIVTYVQTDIPWTAIAQSADDDEIESKQELKCKTPPLSTSTSYLQSKLVHTLLLHVPSPALYTSDFNCQHTDWAYKKSNADGDSLVEWASSIDATLLYDLKEPHTFYSACWDSNTNPNLAFSKC